MNQGILFVEPHYLPCVQYFVYLNSFSKIIIDRDDVYLKQTYRNRCKINGANKIENLIIPIKKISNQKMLTHDVEIDYTQKWHNNHLRAIQSAYGKAPFFEYYRDEIFEIYNKKPCYLLELNKALLTKCLEILDLNLNIEYLEIKDVSNKYYVYDIKNKINPKIPNSNLSIFKPTNYFQVFGNNFADNLSIIDLIFCEGPNARQIIAKSHTME